MWDYFFKSNKSSQIKNIKHFLKENQEISSNSDMIRQTISNYAKIFFLLIQIQYSTAFLINSSGLQIELNNLGYISDFKKILKQKKHLKSYVHIFHRAQQLNELLNQNKKDLNNILKTFKDNRFLYVYEDIDNIMFTLLEEVVNIYANLNQKISLASLKENIFYETQVMLFLVFTAKIRERQLLTIKFLEYLYKNLKLHYSNFIITENYRELETQLDKLDILINEFEFKNIYNVSEVDFYYQSYNYFSEYLRQNCYFMLKNLDKLKKWNKFKELNKIKVLKNAKIKNSRSLMASVLLIPKTIFGFIIDMCKIDNINNWEVFHIIVFNVFFGSSSVLKITQKIASWLNFYSLQPDDNINKHIGVAYVQILNEIKKYKIE